MILLLSLKPVATFELGTILIFHLNGEETERFINLPEVTQLVNDSTRS